MRQSEPILFRRSVVGEHSIGDVDRLVPWWSFTKTVLAACALRLVDDGLLHLDGRLGTADYTLRQLLNHTAGVTCYSFLKPYRQAVENGESAWTNKEMLQRVGIDELIFEPGTGFSYSNIGFMFVRDRIEHACGQPIEEVLKEKLFEPLALANVRFAVTAADLEATAWGNLIGYDPGWVYHGLLLGSARDAVQLLDALLTGDVLSETARESMCTVHQIGGALSGRPWQTHGYGLGLMAGELDGIGRAMGHSGAGPGSVSAIYHFPETSPRVTAAAFAAEDDESITEWMVVKEARHQTQPGF